MDGSTALQQSAHLFALMMIPFLLVTVIIVLIPYWFIFKKAGFPPALSLLMVIPLVGFIMLYVLAFSQWKVVPAAQVQPPQAYPPQPVQPGV